MRADTVALLRRAARPPVQELRFWVIQLVVATIAGLHLLVDMRAPAQMGAFPAGIPVALLIVPVGYAALRYGLAGSAATGVWAVLLWLPDLLLPPNEGHSGGDVVDLLLILVVAFFFGQHIDAERHARARVEQATAEALAVEARYRVLFETNGAPILVLDAKDAVIDANPAAREAFGPDVVGRPSAAILAGAGAHGQIAGQVLTLANGHDFRVDLVPVPASTDGPSVQMIFEDVTEERNEGRRATHYAALVVGAEEEQRRRLARELHDEPLQLFLHLARRIELLAQAPGVPDDVSAGLSEIRRHALDAAARLRTLSRDLRPPALDRLGLVPALRSLTTDLEEEVGLDIRMTVTGAQCRLSPDVELGAFRIVQEALRNVVRHAGTDTCDVTVAFEPETLRVQVSDGGSGFEPTQLDDPRLAHLGVLGMRERSRLLGGELTVRSHPGQGTVVTASLPLHSQVGDAGVQPPVIAAQP